MTSQLETAIQAHRAALLRGDEIALRVMVRAYGPVRRRLIDLITELVDEAVKNGAVSTSKLARLERAQVLLGQVEAELRQFGGSASGFIANGQSQAVQLAIKQAGELIQLQGAAQDVNLATSFNRLNPRAVSDLVGRLSNGQSLGQYFDKLATTTRQQITDALIDGVARGINPRAVADALAKKLDIAGEKLLTVTRTEMLNAYRSASLRTFRENDDILSGWVWISALTGACAACVALSGKEFPLSTEFFPSHARCRCGAVPKLKDSPPLPIKDGEAWFKAQSDEYQDRILRKDGGEAYRNGDVKIGDFVQLNSSAEWGDSYTQGGLADALKRANRRSEAA